MTDASKENIPDRHPIGQEAYLETRKFILAEEGRVDEDEVARDGEDSARADGDEEKPRVKGKKRKRDKTGKYYERVEKNDPSSVYWRKEIGKYLAAEVLEMAKPEVKAMKNLDSEPGMFLI